MAELKQIYNNAEPVSTPGEEASFEAPPIPDADAIVMEGKKRKRLNGFLRFRYLYFLMIPGVVWYICFHIIPLYGLSMAFMDYQIPKGMQSDWVGFHNFEVLFANPEFWRLMGNTVKISALKLVCGFPVPIILALSVNAVGNRAFRKVAQTVSYLPNFISWVVIFGLSHILFNEYTGVVANVWDTLGLPYTDPSKNADTFVAFLVITSIWKGMGMSSIVYLAALSGIDVELYEAAKVDGASRFRQMLSITLPSIAPICAIVLTLNVGSLLGGDFEQIYLFQGSNSELIRVSDIFDTWIYRNGLGAAGEYSMSTALNLFKSAFGAILILLTNAGAKQLGYEGIW